MGTRGVPPCGECGYLHEGPCTNPPKRVFVSKSLQPQTDATRRSDQKHRANKMEKATAKRYGRFGAQKQPGSGSGHRKGDVRTAVACVDDKFTDKLSFTVKQEDLAKLCSDAEGEGNSYPVMKIRFDKPIDELRFRPKHWALVPEDVYLEYEELKKREREQR